jgi:hypothetical protein
MTAPLATITNDDDLTSPVDALAHENADWLMSIHQQHKYVRPSIKAHKVVFVIWEENDHIHYYCIKARNRLGRLKTTAFVVKGRRRLRNGARVPRIWRTRCRERSSERSHPARHDPNIRNGHKQ